jgi:hypothetical protein
LAGGEKSGAATTRTVESFALNLFCRMHGIHAMTGSCGTEPECIEERLDDLRKLALKKLRLQPGR